MRPTDGARRSPLGFVAPAAPLNTPSASAMCFRLARWGGGYYWISFDHAELRLGDTLLDAEHTAAMARVGRALK